MVIFLVKTIKVIFVKVIFVICYITIIVIFGVFQKNIKSEETFHI